MSRRVGPIRVLASFPEPRPTTNPYIVMLAKALRATPGVELSTFSWRRGILGGYDVLHVHWPETLVARSRGLRRRATQALVAIMLMRVVLARKAVVRTVHNLQPHETVGAVESLLLKWFDHVTTARILLNEAELTPGGAPTATILHGHYVDWFAGLSRHSPTKGALAFVGLVRPYKNVVGLVTAFRGVADPTLRLRIVGRPSSPELASAITKAAAGDVRVSVVPEYVPDERLVREVTAAELVALPYAEMYNSGAALMALSLARPVLVPDNDVTRRLADEVGAAWVQRFSAPLESGHLVRALAAAHEAVHGGSSPDLSSRSWEIAGSQHLRVYREAVERRRQSGSRR